MSKSIYEKPAVEILELVTEDAIRTSLETMEDAVFDGYNNGTWN